MKTLTKDQIQQLTPEQQETIATLEVGRIKKRQKLLQYARGYRGKWIVEAVLVAVGLGLYYFSAPKVILAAFCIFGFGLLIHFHVSGINRRIDGLIELLKLDEKTGEDDDA